MCEFAGAVISKYRRLGGFNNTKVFSHSSECEESDIKVLAGLAAHEAPVLGV